MRKSIAVVLTSLTILLSGCASTQKASPTATAGTPPSPEAMQAAFEAGSKVGPQHALLKQLAGTWSADVKWWMDPSGKPEVSKGKSVNTPILGGRFIREEYSGKMMGQQFQGVGLLGYDNVTKEYTSSWIDSMSTSMMTSVGNYDEASKAFTYTSTFSCPLTNSKRQMKSVTKVIDKNHHVFEMYDQGPDGKEFKNLEIAYKRVK